MTESPPHSRPRGPLLRVPLTGASGVSRGVLYTQATVPITINTASRPRLSSERCWVAGG